MEHSGDLLAGYRKGAAGTSHADPNVANGWQKKMHACYKKLRESEDGRSGIIGLMTDTDPHVRLWAAGHCLEWVPVEARAVLEALRDGDGPGSFDAKWTLIEYDKGKLSFDY